MMNMVMIVAMIRATDLSLGRDGLGAISRGLGIGGSLFDLASRSLG